MNRCFIPSGFTGPWVPAAWWAASVLLAVGMVSPTWAWQDRRSVETPGLVIDSPAPTAATDVLTFLPDGKHLLAAGDDKVVRSWSFTQGQVVVDSIETLRWSTWRERRGSIYAVALSPDDQVSKVAVAGYGIKNGAVSVLERGTARVVAGLTNPNDDDAIWALAFSPSGHQVAIGTDHGNLRVWNWDAAKANDVRTLGRQGNGQFRVLQVRYRDDNRLWAVVADGSVQEWDVRTGQSRELFRLTVPSNPGAQLKMARFSGDGHVLASAAERSRHANFVELIGIDGQNRRKISLPPEHFPRALALNQTGSKLAVGLTIDPRPDPSRHTPWLAANAAIQLYDVAATPKLLYDRFECTYLIEQLAFSPDSRYLTSVGGDDFSLSVWDLQTYKLTDVVTGPGRCLWDVAFSADGRYLGFRDQRNPAPRSFNDWGSGPWQVFDLRKLNWIPTGQPFVPVRNRETWPEQGGERWSVECDPNSLFVWYVVKRGPAGENRRFKLPLEMVTDQRPTCYTFLPTKPGGPARLVVGHYWGASLFEFADNRRPQRVRLFNGHQGIVSALGISADGKVLVTASRDGTVWGWNLQPWPNHEELGASFQVKEGKLTTVAVDSGSPAWESGLMAGDQLVKLAFNGKWLEADLGAWAERLRNPVPGLELVYVTQRPGETNTATRLTTVRQRPLWQFFPTRADDQGQREWILWRWRDYRYATSTYGDRYLGWQTNGDVDTTPGFDRAEQFRDLFHKPDMVVALLLDSFTAPQKAAIPDMRPPKVLLDYQADAAPGMDRVRVTVAPNTIGPVQDIREVALWINDYRFRRWAGRVPFQETIDIPQGLLRRGEPGNNIFAQVYTPKGVRGNSQKKTRVLPGEPEPWVLHGLFVGVANYRLAATGPNGHIYWSNLLFPVDDARAMFKLWQEQNPPNSRARLVLLEETQASKQNILDTIRAFADIVKPDDRLVVFIAGHGYAAEKNPGSSHPTYDPNSFHYVTSTFDVNNPHKTGVSAPELAEALAAVPCRKLLLLDTCHSGAVSSADMVRDVTPEGVVPLIMNSASKDEAALEHPALGHGVFTQAILDVYETLFPKDAPPATLRPRSPADLEKLIPERVKYYLSAIAEALGATGGRGGVNSLKQTPCLGARPQEEKKVEWLRPTYRASRSQ